MGHGHRTQPVHPRLANMLTWNSHKANLAILPTSISTEHKASLIHHLKVVHDKVVLRWSYTKVMVLGTWLETLWTTGGVTFFYNNDDMLFVKVTDSVTGLGRFIIIIVVWPFPSHTCVS